MLLLGFGELYKMEKQICGSNAKKSFLLYLHTSCTDFYNSHISFPSVIARGQIVLQEVKAKNFNSSHINNNNNNDKVLMLVETIYKNKVKMFKVRRREIWRSLLEQNFCFIFMFFLLYGFLHTASYWFHKEENYGEHSYLPFTHRSVRSKRRIEKHLIPQLK